MQLFPVGLCEFVGDSEPGEPVAAMPVSATCVSLISGVTVPGEPVALTPVSAWVWTTATLPICPSAAIETAIRPASAVHEFPTSPIVIVGELDPTDPVAPEPVRAAVCGPVETVPGDPVPETPVNAIVKVGATVPGEADPWTPVRTSPSASPALPIAPVADTPVSPIETEGDAVPGLPVQELPVIAVAC